MKKKTARKVPMIGHRGGRDGGGGGGRSYRNIRDINEKGMRGEEERRIKFRALR